MSWRSVVEINGRNRFWPLQTRDDPVQTNVDLAGYEVIEQLRHLCGCGRIQGREVSILDKRPIDVHRVSVVIDPRGTLHRGRTNNLFSACWRQREGHSQGNLLMILPVIHLWLVRN